MPNYSLVSNAVFQPFSYQELLAPVMHQQQVQDQLAEQYEKLSSQADILEAMGANDRDSKAYRNFKNYSDNLRMEADNLYRNGLNSESRLRLSELKRRYNSEIVPIQNAWNKREEEALMQMKASLSNPMIRFTRDASKTSLDQYLANPSGGYGVINLANIATQASAAFKNLSKQIRDKVKVEGIDPLTNNYIQTYGLSPDIINNWLQNPSKNPAMTNIVKLVLASNGLTEDVIRNNPNLLVEATQAALSGAWNAIGEDKSQIGENKYASKMLDYELSQRAADNAAAREIAKAKATAASAGGMDYIDTSEYELPMGGADFSRAKKQENAMKTLGYLMRNGTLHPTGKVEINGNQVSLFGRDGKIMTRKQFVGQAKTEKDRKDYDKYFDKMVDAGKEIGVYGTMYTQNQLSGRYAANRRNSAASYATVNNLNYEKGDWNTTSKGYKVREIKEYRGRKPVFDTEAISLNDLLNRKNSDKTDINVSAHWSNVKGQEGLILSTVEDGKDKRYFIGADEMPERNIQEARYWFGVAEEYRKAGDQDSAKIAKTTALSKLHTGLTIHNKGYDQNTVRQLSLKQQGLAD